MHGEAERAFLAFREGGRPRDLARVFDLVAQELLLVAGHLARGEMEAEELVQQTFLAAIERRASWDAGRPLAPWLLGILVRLARGERRRLGKERERGGGALETLASEAAGPARLAEDAELAAALAGAIAALPEAYREVLSLRLVHGLEAVEIAHALGRPLETVKTQLKRGKERLREALPRSLAALVALERDGLAAVRSAVLAAAQGSAAGTAVMTWGVLLMSKKAVGVAVALACAGALWWTRSTGDGEHEPAPTPVSAAAPLTRPSGPEDEAELVPAETASREAVTPSEPELLESTTARLTCRVTFESDGAPAEGVTVALSSGRSTRVRVTPEALVSADGVAVFEDQPIGPARVMSDRGAYAELELVPGENEVEVAIAAGVFVEGVVLDESNAPVPGAELWLSSYLPDDGEGWWIGHAGGDGRFTVRDVRWNGQIAARSQGRAPGDAVVVTVAVGERMEVTLHVGAAGPRLQGVVRDELGALVPGAYLFAGHASGGHLARRVSATLAAPPPQWAVTDEQGRFEIIALPPAGSPLWIAAEGFAVGHEELTLERVVRPLEITLVREARVTGSVSDASGDPLEGVEVRAWPEGDLRGPILPPRWGEAMGWTRHDGSFELAGLQPGPVELRASVRGFGEARESVVLVAGETTTWLAEIRPADELAGSVVDESGAPLAGVSVRATCEDLANQPHHLESTVTDEDGRFRIPGAVCERYTLSVSEVGPDLCTPLERTAVAPGTEVEFVLGTQQRASARLTGRLLMPDGSPFEAMKVELFGAIRDGIPVSGGKQSSCVGGQLVTGLIPPGAFTLVVTRDSYRWTVGTFEVVAGEVRDIGAQVCPAAGRLELELVDAAGLPVKNARFRLRAETHVTGSLLEFKDGHEVLENVQPGRYRLDSFGNDVPKTRVELEVLAGETTRRTITLPAAFDRWLRFPSPTKVPVLECLHTWTCDGVELARGRWTFRSLSKSTPHKHRLPPGRHAITFTADDGASETTTFDVSAETSSPEQVVEVRAPFD